MTLEAKKTTRIQEQNQERILAAALSVFSRYGYRGATVDQIASETGMSKANLLYYFKRKKDVYLAVLENTLSQWLAPLETLDPDGDAVEQLWRYAQAKLELSRSNPQASKVFANEILQGAPMITPFLREDLKVLVTSKCAVIQQWVDKGHLVPIDPRHLLFMIWATTQHYADFRTQIDALSDVPEDQLFESAATTLRAVLEGLRPPTLPPVN